MSIEEKIKTAKEDSWLKDSVSEKEFKEIKDNERIMTNEEAKQIFLNNGFVNGIFDGDKWRESIIVISKWLKQEPYKDLIAEIDKLPRIKVGNSNSPTVKYCIDEVLLYDLLEHYKTEKTAEWKNNCYGFWICTKCGYSLNNSYYTVNYCPNCGAKMKGVAE